MIRILFAIIPTLLLVHLTSTSLFGSIGTGLGEIWEMTPGQIVWLQAAFVMGYAARVPPSRFAATIVSDRTMFIIAFAISAIAAACLHQFSEGFAVAMIFRLIEGAAIGAMLMPAVLLLEAKMGRAAGILIALVVIAGWALSVPLTAIVSTTSLAALSNLFVQAGGWSTIFVLKFLATLAWILPAWWLLPKARP